MRCLPDVYNLASCISSQFSFRKLYQAWMHYEILSSIFQFLWNPFNSIIQVLKTSFHDMPTHNRLEPISKFFDAVT